jgi:hypothetical protein
MPSPFKLVRMEWVAVDRREFAEFGRMRRTTDVGQRDRHLADGIVAG